MIKYINIDPNGICNAKCWFCPVAYVGNSKENKTNMSIETMENILNQINEGRNIFVEDSTELMSFGIHFNEVLLYPHFKEMLELHRKYKIKFGLYSNGVNLTKEKIDLIEKYRDVVTQITLNIPSLEEKQWSSFTGFNVKIFKKLLDNLKYAEKILSPIYDSHDFFIMVNGVNENSLFKNGGWIDVLDNAPIYNFDNNNGTLAQIVKNMQQVVPTIRVMGRNNLGDRTSVLSKLNIISNQRAIQEKNNGKVIGCGLNYDQDTLYISATGNVYLCCVDFDYETVYANIKDKSIKEIWQGNERKKAIKKAYDGICKNCLHAVRKEGSGPSLTKVV
jgi:radical SAM protein with 4Fe4S-binding SPASM domain